jgi:hypothetical protein
LLSFEECWNIARHPIDSAEGIVVNMPPNTLLSYENDDIELMPTYLKRGKKKSSSLEE